MLKRDRRALGSPYGMPIGLQLLTVADHLKNDLEGTLKKVAELGYREVELGVFDFYGKQPAELRRILSDQGLRAVSLHFTESQLKSDPKKHIMDAKACGTSYIGLASLDAKDRASLDAVKRDAEWFNEIGKLVASAGNRFFYHGHNFDYKAVDGVAIYDELIRRTDPKLVNFELDCFWCVRAGKDPVDYFHRFPGRFPQLHIKDLKPGYPPTTEHSPPEAFTEVGTGVIDWKRIFKAARAGGMQHFYVEQDHSDRDSLESARMSYEYIHKLSV
jgi:sugar phosphate isomerase/epimerase